MRPIWKGSISFGLVTIPVQIMNATNEAEKISFKMLRRADLSPIRYKRVAEVDEKEVPWGNIVKGYEYEKGQFVVMDEKDFDKVDLKGTDSIEILDFVKEAEVEPIYFYKPYYIEPLKGAAGAYGLLREVLDDTGKIGIAKVVIRNRQHLAAVKAKDDLLVLELMRFANEIAPVEEIKVPSGRVDKRAVDMAKTLVEQMTSKWKPENYVDDYAERLKELIDKKIKAGGKALPDTQKKRTSAPTNVVDLVAVLEQSLGNAGKSGRRAAHSAEQGERAEIIPSRIRKRAPASAKRGTKKRAAKRKVTHKRAA